MELFKRYVDMELEMDADGTIIPIALWWLEKGQYRRYEIDKVLSGPLPRASKAGGCGNQYIIKIHGQQRTIYQEKPDLLAEGRSKWFIESQKP